jgi:hypothetical protein
VTTPSNIATGEEVFIHFSSATLVDGGSNDLTGLFDVNTWNLTTVADPLPTISSLSPIDGGNLNEGFNITATFSEPVFKNNGKVRFYRTSDTALLSELNITDSRVVINGSEVVITPPSNLPANVDFFVHFNNTALRDAWGNNIAGVFTTTTWNLTLLPDPSPTIVSLSPTDGSGITLGATAVVTFSEDVFKGNGKVRVYKKSDLTVLKVMDITDADITVSGAAVSVVMPSDLLVGEEILIHFAPTSLADSGGNGLGGLFDADTWNLIPELDASPAINSLSPVDGSNTIGEATFTATFSETLTKGSGKLRIYKRSDLTVLSTTDISSGSITLSGSTMSFDLPSGLPLGEELLIHLSSDALVDGGGNNINGLFTTDTWNFTVTSNPSGAVNAENTFVAPEPEPEQEAEVQLAFTIYPNPAEDQITIELSEYGGKEVAISIINEVGMSLYQKQGVSTSSHAIDVSNYSQGMYIVTIAHGKGFSRKKLIIRR